MTIVIGFSLVFAMVFAAIDERKDWSEVAAWGCALCWFVLYAWR